MKRTFYILLFCALLLTTGCGGGPSHIVNDADREEPIRIIAVIVSSSPAPEKPAATPTPVITLEPTKEPSPAPTNTPVPTDTPAPAATPETDGTAEPAAETSPTPGVSSEEQFIMIAQQYLNYPYTRGGKSPDQGFDPSGLVYWCLNEMGMDVKRRTSAGYSEEEGWEKITRMSELEPGDLAFFRTGDNENINCVCIYLGNNRMIYPSTSKQTVIITEVNSYWTNAFQWARRVF